MNRRNNSLGFIPYTEAIKAAWNYLGIGGKVFGSSPERKGFDIVFSKKFFCLMACRSGDFFFIDQNRIPLHDIEFASATHAFCKLLGECFHSLVRFHSPCFVESSKGTFELHFIRNNVGCSISNNFSKRKNRRD